MDDHQLFSGEIYDPGQPDLATQQLKWLTLSSQYNLTKASEQGLRTHLLNQIFASVGENTYVEAPYHANWGGHHVHLGKNVYTNFNLTLVDDGEIFIADHVMIGPNVTIDTAAHPLSPSQRKQGLQYNLPVHIAENVWIGAGVIILPGVTIGANSIIGAGSLVNKDIPANVVAVGTPCKVLHEITDK